MTYLPVSLTLGLLLAGAPRSQADPRLDGPAIVLGFHVQPPSSGQPQLPLSPQLLVSSAPDTGLWDVWLVVLTRAPLIGAWTLNVALDYDATPDCGIDVLEWENLADEARPRPEWPEAGAGRGCEFVWPRETRCFTPEQGLVAGVDGWWLQVAARFRVAVHGPDLLTVTDPEPGVRPQEVECQDEYHPFNDDDSWTAVFPARFDPPPPGTPVCPGRVPVVPIGWSELKLRSVR